TTTALLETGIVHIKSPIEAGRRAISGIKQDGSHKSGGAVSMVEQIWEVGQPSGKRRAQFADLMCLRISACQNCRVRHHRERRLRVGMLKDDALPSKTVEVGRQCAVRTEKTHAVGSRRIQRDENNIWFARSEKGSWKGNRDQKAEKNQSSGPQHEKQSNAWRPRSETDQLECWARLGNV